MTGDVQFIGLDWGTSNLRAYLYDVLGNIVDTRQQGWGIRHLPQGGFPAAMRAMTSGWPPCVVLAAGMVGSRQGWLEVPYVDVPADTSAIANGVRRVEAYTRQPVWIVPGLRQGKPADVMRGEETQIIGALALQGEHRKRARLVLPGTHSKWVAVDGKHVDAFHTFMTGEMYALIIKQSILAAGVSDGQDKPLKKDAFLRGVQCARESGSKGAWSRLFSVRTLMLNGELSPDDTADFLSGLLIGEEFRVMRSSDSFDANIPISLIGEASLCHRYAMAAEHFDYHAPSIVHDASSYGLWELARQSGLLTQAHTYAFAGARA